MRKLFTILGVGLLACSTANAQQINGDDLTLDGAGNNPLIEFEQADGDSIELRTFTSGGGFFFDQNSSYPFYMFEGSPSQSLWISNAKVDVGNLLEASAGINVIGDADVTGNHDVGGDASIDGTATVLGGFKTDGDAILNANLNVEGAFQLNGTFDADGDSTPTFTSTSASPPSLSLRSTDSQRFQFLNSVGYFTSSPTGSGYMLYGWDDPITQQLVVRGDRSVNPGVGIGTFFPEAELHILADGNPYETAEFIVENNVSTVAQREMFQLINNGGVRFAMENTDTGTRWDFTNNSIGDFLVNLAGSGGPEMTVTKAGRFFTGPAGFKAFDARSNGNVWIAGTYNQTSDRTKKENFAKVDPNEVLEKLTNIPVTTWNYKTDEEEVRHMGPMAQDFHAAFELGESDRVIALADMFGVSVTAIKALNEQSKEKDSQIEALKQQVAAQAEQIAAQANQAEELEAINARMELLESLLIDR